MIISESNKSSLKDRMFYCMGARLSLFHCVLQGCMSAWQIRVRSDRERMEMELNQGNSWI